MSETNESYLSQLLTAASRLTGLSLCYHDYLMVSRLPLELREHQVPACLAFKSGTGRDLCMSFCGVGGEVDRQVKGVPEGWKHTCPHGLRQIALPVFAGRALAGVLFAVAGEGQKEDSPYGSAAGPDGFEVCRVLLTAVSGRIEQLLAGGGEGGGETRKGQIQDFFHASLEEPVRIGDLAACLGLSPSRTGHLVQELFGMTFPRMLNQARLNRAAVWLAGSERPVSAIAVQLCFYDQSHFTRAFRRHFGQSPQRFRKQSRRAY